MNNFIFQNQTKVYFGNDLSALPKEISKYGNKVMIAYGSNTFKLTDTYQAIIKSLEENQIRITT